MKKLLFGILTFLGIGLSFCSADTIFIGNLYSVGNNNSQEFLGLFPGDSLVISNNWDWAGENYYIPTYYNGQYYSNSPINSLTLSTGDYFMICGVNRYSAPFTINYSDSTSCSFDSSSDFSFYCCSSVNSNNSSWVSFYYTTYKTRAYSFFYNSVGGGSSTPSISDINVYYNNGNSVENITCDGTQAIEIKGLSSITSTNTFTPYYNISYIDEDNQKLIESYSKDTLYLSGGLFKKTYTGDNERILTDTIESPNSSFSGYVPVFDVTGSTQPIDTEYNMFNNFTDNSLKVLLSNIPSFFQYVIIFSIILIIIGIVKVFKRKK